jgi:hypothetical protein
VANETFLHVHQTKPESTPTQASHAKQNATLVPFFSIASSPLRDIYAVVLLELFLGAQLTGMSTLFLSAIGGTGRETRIALSAHGLVAIVPLGQEGQTRVVDSSAKAQYQMQGRFFLNIVIRESTAIFQLLSSKDESLLVRWDALLVLDFGLDVVDGVARLNVQSNSLTREGFYENLHGVQGNKAIDQVSCRHTASHTPAPLSL